MVEVFLEPALKDNYIAFVREPKSGSVLVVDPSEAQPALNFLQANNWRADLILNTHHHWDHVGGNDALNSQYGCPIYASPIDAEKIHGVTKLIKDGEKIAFGNEVIRAISIPGHTLGHTAFYFENSHVVFAGDTLFSLGCGRLFEGTHEQMWTSLQKLASLPDDTKLYCGHEYTLANAKFALLIEPENFELRRREQQARLLRDQSLPTLPSTIGLEKATNPFLRAGNLERFIDLRRRKDTFS
jgi:hydroxyacylglutathione hydrolase